MQNFNRTLLVFIFSCVGSIHTNCANASGEQSAEEIARQEVSDQGLNLAQPANKAALEIKTAADAAVAVGCAVPAMSEIEILVGHTEDYQANYGRCVNTQSTASWLCRERTSPELQNGLNIVNTMMGGMSAMSGVKDKCDTITKIMDAAKMALTAYTAACSAARGTCEGFCTQTMNALKGMAAHSFPGMSTCHETAPPVLPGVIGKNPVWIQQKAACEKFLAAFTKNFPAIESAKGQDMNVANPKSIAMKDKACSYGSGNYALMLASAGMGIMNVVQTMSQSQDCGEKADGSGVKTSPTSTPDPCAVSKESPECICKMNPRTQGCVNGLDKTGSESSSTLRSVSSLPSLGKVGTGGGANFGGNTTAPGSNPNSKGDSGSGSSMAGGSGGGGAPLSGGGISGGSSADGKNGVAADDNNVVADVSSSGYGGGGGGWRGGFGSGAGDGNSPYKAYMPGGTKDPAKALAGQQAWASEVTGSGGKSNFEKVKDRYRDNKGTLIGH